MSVELTDQARRESAQGHEWIVVSLSEEPAEEWATHFRRNLAERLPAWTLAEKAMMNSLHVGKEIRFILNDGIAEDLGSYLTAISDAVAATNEELSQAKASQRLDEGARAALSDQRLSAVDDALKRWSAGNAED
jgi:hypothetical protein